MGQSVEKTVGLGVRGVAEDIGLTLNRLDSEPSYSFICVNISRANIRVNQSFLTVEKAGKKYTIVVPENTEAKNLEDVTSFCAVKSGNTIKIYKERPICNNNFICEPDECKTGCNDCFGPKQICVGDEFCNPTIGENCVNSQDCACNNTCCPDDPASDEIGCTDSAGIGKGQQCWCDNQCEAGLKCNPTADEFKDYAKACCEEGMAWNGTGCEESICSSSISRCYNHWHWEHYGTWIKINDRQSTNPSHPSTYDPYNQPDVTTCDMYEVCHPIKVEDITKEIEECCDNRCSGNCHSMCKQALLDSGLSSTDTPETRKKCYGLYTIYGMGPAAAWTKGYRYHLEQPASIMFSGDIWMCTGYSIMLTTLLKSVGYEKNEIYGVCGPRHMFNLIKLPGDKKYRIVDTVGNILYIAGFKGHSSYPYYGSFGFGCGGCSNDAGSFSCPPRGDVVI